MSTVGIVAEYNPFHTGHGYQIEETRRRLGEDCPVVAVMSGNWTQGGRPAFADKWVRSRMALLGGVDLVLELPTPWAMSSAEEFARGAVEILAATGVVSHLSFGSESGEVEGLSRAARCLDTPAYAQGLRERLPTGLPFAACRQRVVEELAGPQVGGLLANPNNNLGIEYLRALNRLQCDLIPLTVERRGAAHDTVAEGETDHWSATQIRGHLLAGEWEACTPYLPGLSMWKESPHLTGESLELAQRLILARLRGMGVSDWEALPDSGAAEGLPHLLYRAGRTAVTLEDFYQQVKSKRFPHARLRRLALWAYLGLEGSDRPEQVPYLRVLAFNRRGQQLLARMRTTATLPVVIKAGQVGKLSSQAQALFDREVRCTDRYDLLLPQLPAPGREWRTGPYRLEGGSERGERG